MNAKTNGLNSHQRSKGRHLHTTKQQIATVESTGRNTREQIIIRHVPSEGSETVRLGQQTALVIRSVTHCSTSPSGGL